MDNKKIITDWNDVPEWKDRSITNFSHIFSKYKFSEEILDEYLSIKDSLKGNTIGTPLLATKYLLHTRWQDWKQPDYDNLTTPARDELISHLLDLDVASKTIGQKQPFSINLVMKHPWQLGDAALVSNPHFMPEANEDAINDVFDMAVSAYDIIHNNLTTYRQDLHGITEEYDFKLVDLFYLENPSFLYRNNTILSFHEKLDLLKSNNIDFDEPEMVEIIYNSLETRWHKEAMETVLHSRLVNTDFLERYYKDIKDFNLISNVLYSQELSEGFLDNHWPDIKDDYKLLETFKSMDNLSEDFIDKHAEDITNLDIWSQDIDAESCWSSIARWYAKTPEFVTKHAEQLKPYLFYLQRNTYLSKKYTEDEIQAFVEPEKAQKIMTDVQETILNTLKESGLSAKDALKVLDNIKAKGNEISQAKEIAASAPQR